MNPSLYTWELGQGVMVTAKKPFVINDPSTWPDAFTIDINGAVRFVEPEGLHFNACEISRRWFNNVGVLGEVASRHAKDYVVYFDSRLQDLEAAWNQDVELVINHNRTTKVKGFVLVALKSLVR